MAKSVAAWDSSLGLARVTKQKGKRIAALGMHIESVLHLRPEEAMCLVEDRAIQLSHDGIQLSVQEAHVLLVQNDIDFYTVYAKLHRMGYVGRRRGLQDFGNLEASPRALLATYDRRNFSKRAVDREAKPADYLILIYRVDDSLPRVCELEPVIESSAPSRLVCACVADQGDVLFFDVDGGDFVASTNVVGLSDAVGFGVEEGAIPEEEG